MGTAHATQSFVSSRPGRCIAWMTGPPFASPPTGRLCRPPSRSADFHEFQVNLILCPTPTGPAR
jgi:hypothetical protein